MSGTNEQFEVIRRYSIAFLEKHVAGMKGSDDVLKRTDPMFKRYLREPLPWVKKHNSSSGKTAGQNAPADVYKPRR
jgi:hypothetical protein